MKIVNFDSSKGKKLWMTIEMTGIYYITYTYQLEASSLASAQPVLSNPIKSGSNESPFDDVYQVLNDYNTADPLSAYHKRILDMRFIVRKMNNEDNGYKLQMKVFQADQVSITASGIQVTGGSQISNDSDLLIDVDAIGNTSNYKQEFFAIRLIDINA